MNCYHCQLPVTEASAIYREFDNKKYVFCCRGCATVFQMINQNKLSSYYQKRALTGSEIPIEPVQKKDYHHFDRPSIYKRYVSTNSDGTMKSLLLIDGVTCAACTWLIETYLLKQKGVVSVEVNFSTQRANISWNPEEITFAGVFKLLGDIGYHALPYDPATQEKQQQKLRRVMLIRLAVAGFCAGNIMMLSISLYSGYLSGIQNEFKLFFQMISGFLSLPAVFYSATPFWSGALKSIRMKYPNMDLLISLGIFTTFSYSVAILIEGEGETYFDSCTMLIFILLIGRTLEHLTRSRILNISELLSGLTPRFITRLDEKGDEVSVSVDELIIGDRLRIKPGDSIPVDGCIHHGEGEINESALTGENQWRYVKKGDRVLSGTLNQLGSFVMKAEKIGQDSTVQRIIALVNQVSNKKTKIQKMADFIAARFVWVVIFLSIFTFGYWTWFSTQPSDLSPLLISVSVIIIACPCALGLATPMTILAATGLAFRRKILIKSGEFLEEADQITDIVFDKTGTLTSGDMQVVNTGSLGDMSESDWFTYACQLEQVSNHPIAKAIREAAKSKKIQFQETSVVKFMQYPGSGVRGFIDNQEIKIGNSRFVSDALSTVASIPEEITEKSIMTVRVFIAVDNVLQGYIDLQDALKTESKVLIDHVKAKKLTTHLLSGDVEERVTILGGMLGIDNAQGGMLPGEKLEYLQNIQSQNRKVIMVGDGINDAPALTCANIGIAVHNATELSMEAADVVFLNSNLKDLITFLAIALNSKKIIKQNLVLALLYNACTLPLAVFGFVTPLLSAVFMACSSLVVTLNLLRLKAD